MILRGRPNIGFQRTSRLRLAAAEAGSLGGRAINLVIVAVAITLTASAAERRWRPFEIHLAQIEEAPGLIPMHIVDRAEIVYINPRTELDDRDIQEARMLADSLNRTAVQVHLNKAGVKKLRTLFATHQGGHVALIERGKVLSAPAITGQLVDDLLDITGTFSTADAERLVSAINGK